MSLKFLIKAIAFVLSSLQKLANSMVWSPSKNLNIKIYKTIVLPVVLYKC
jgi:hypothetical protein